MEIGASPGPATSPLERGTRHLAAVDGLRAFAVVAVLVFHLRGSALPGGFTGVDVFFVISGYVVSLALLDHSTERLLPFLQAFYMRRIARIYPALIVVLLVTVVLSSLFIPFASLSVFNEGTGALAFWGASNWGLVHLTDNYFSPRTDFNPYTHTWSLAVEEQFYLVFSPIFFLALRSLGTARSRLAAAILPALCLASLLYSAWVSLRGSSAAFYDLPSRFWEMGAGALLLQAHAKGRLLPRTEGAPGRCALAGLVLLVVSVIFADNRLFPFPWAIPAVLGTALFISAASAAAARNETTCPILGFFSRPAVVYLGLISYSLYLWHWPLAVLARWTFGLSGPAAYAIVTLLSLGLAALSYRIVETPMRRVFRKSACPGLALALGLVAVYAAQSLYYEVLDHRGRLSRSKTKTADWTVYPLGPDGLAPIPGRPWSDRTIFVMGDSHALAYSDMMRRLNKEMGPRIELYSKPGCWIATLLNPSVKSAEGCHAFLGESLEAIGQKAGPKDAVLLAALRVVRLGDQWGVYSEEERAKKLNTPEAKLDRVASFEETRDIVRRIESMGARPIMDAPPPLFPSPAFRCVDWYDAHNPVCRAGLTVTKAFFEDWRSRTMRDLSRLQRDESRLVVWDPLEALCPTSVCHALEADGRPLFFDGDHLSVHGDDVVYPSFLRTLEGIWGHSPAVSRDDAAKT